MSEASKAGESKPQNSTVADNKPRGESPAGADQSQVNLAILSELNRLRDRESGTGPVAPAVGLFESDIPGCVFRFGTGKDATLKNAHGDVVDEDGEVKSYAPGRGPDA